MSMQSPKKASAALFLGALGVVFGDIGTSPLYALRAVFGPDGANVPLTPANVYGVTSLIIWSVTLVVSVKFILFIMRADNDGEGGIMALITRIMDATRGKKRRLFILIGLIGVALFYGDSVITPAISVMSAVEGLHVIAPQLSGAVLPITLFILAALFAVQRYGTDFIGRIFGPVMLVWFAALAVGGLLQVWQHPDVLVALSPLCALSFFATNPLLGFSAMAAVVLAVTGAEALYADMGHFGRPPIAKAWGFVVFPALALCYMGEGALLLHSPEALSNPLLFLYPESLRVGIVILATAATIIASQSVISGTFSLTRQAIQLNFLPKMLVRHTSVHSSGQIYLPFVNWLLFAAVVGLVLLFGSSAHLAQAYGIAVSGTLLADTLLYLVAVQAIWRMSASKLLGAALLFLPIDILFVLANTTKLTSGGLYPVIIGAAVFAVIATWRKGQRIIVAERKHYEGQLQAFITNLHVRQPTLERADGTVVYIGHHSGFTPTALRATYEDLHELPAHVVIVYIKVASIAHIPEDQRARVDSLHYIDGISRVDLTFGYHDKVSLPETLANLRRLSPELAFDEQKAAYVVSRNRVVTSGRHAMPRWQKQIYGFLARNARSDSDYLQLPLKRTTEIQTVLTI